MNAMTHEELDDMRAEILQITYFTLNTIDWHYLHAHSYICTLYFAIEEMQKHLDAMRQEFSELHDREKEIRKMKADSTEPAKVKS